jgi:hypothetical protein
LSFNVANILGSYAPDRFYIVFKTYQSLPVKFAGISAWRKNENNISVNWNVENESDVDHYELERSANGMNFESIQQQLPLNNNYESFNTFPMDDMIMKEVFNYCEQPEEQEPTHSINLPVAEHVNIVIEDNDNNEILQQKDEIKNNDVFDLKKDENDNVSVNSNLTKKKLNKLNLEGLKQKCVELNLQADGSKNDLIERILNNDS